MSVVVSVDFCCLKLALPSVLFTSKDEVKAVHSDFDRCPRGGSLRTENPPDRHFSQPQLRRCKIIAPWDMSQYQNSPRISLETSVFYPRFEIEIFDLLLLCIFQGTHNNNSVGRRYNFITLRIMSLVKSCLLSNPV